MIKYRTRFGKLEAIEVGRETAKMVYVNGYREGKRSEWSNYYDSFDEAKETLTYELYKEVLGLRKRLEIAQEKLETAQNLRLTPSTNLQE